MEEQLNWWTMKDPFPDLTRADQSIIGSNSKEKLRGKMIKVKRQLFLKGGLTVVLLNRRSL